MRLLPGIGWLHLAMRDMVGTMYKLHEIAKSGEGLRPELRALYERLAKDRYSNSSFERMAWFNLAQTRDENTAQPRAATSTKGS